jgi:HD-like signal output (HDOD) protein
MKTGRLALDMELPTPPAALLRMAALLAQPECDLDDLGELIESDMSLASALLRTVNSSLFNLSGRVQTVREAITYLGMREVSGLALQHGLRAAFPQSPELDHLWQRAAARGELMGVLGQALGFDAWAAHSAGLFEECGKALLFRHSPVHYRSMWAAEPTDDSALSSLEQDAFGVSHDILGAALSETWGLLPSAVHCVRHHVEFQSTLVLPKPDSHRAICALSALAHRVMSLPADTARCVELVATQLDMPTTKVAAVVPLGRHRLGGQG